MQLPVELWQNILEYIPDHDICRLRSLNSTFFQKALDIHYGTLAFTLRWWYQPQDMTYLPREQYVISRIHSLEVSMSRHNHYTLSSLLSPTMQWRRHRQASSRHQEIESLLGQLPPLKHLKFDYEIRSHDGYQSPLVEMPWRVACNTIVSLDLRIHTLALPLDKDFLPSSIFCPNLRTLSVSFLAHFPPPVIKALHRIAPPALEYLNLNFRTQCYWDPEALRPLHRFNQLRGFHFECHDNKSVSADIFTLIKMNATTLERLVFFPDTPAGIDAAHPFTFWGPKIRTLITNVHHYKKHKALFTSEMAKCSPLINLQLLEYPPKPILYGSYLE